MDLRTVYAPLFFCYASFDSKSHRTEHVNQAKKREGDLKIPALLQSNEALADPVKISGIKYLEININGKGFERSLLWQLKAKSFV